MRLAHNYFLQVLHAGGFVALGIFGMWIIGLGYLYASHFRREYLLTNDPDRQLLWVTMTSLILCFAVHGYAQTFITDRNGYLWVGILLAYGMRMQQISLDRSASPVETTPALRARSQTASSAAGAAARR